MAGRRCGCASDSCACVVEAGDGIQVTGTGIPTNPYRVTSTAADIETGIDVQDEGTNVVLDIHGIDFRGSAVTVTPGTDKAVVSIVVPDPTSGAVIPTGTIFMFGMSPPPSGWLPCNGGTYTVAAQPNLYAAIGNNFGGTPGVDFKVPDLSDRFPVGASGSKPINGTPGGAATATLSAANLPPHTHSIAHNHPAVNTSSDGSHDHNLEMSDSTGTAASVRRGTTSSAPGAGAIHNNGGHVHSINLGNFTGNSGTGAGTATPVAITPPYQALVFGIKT